MKNVLCLRASHRHVPSEELLERTMYWVFQKYILPSIIPPSSLSSFSSSFLSHL